MILKNLYIRLTAIQCLSFLVYLCLYLIHATIQLRLVLNTNQSISIVFKSFCNDFVADFETLFISLMKRIPIFREINAKHAMELNNMKMSSPETIFKLPELHKEVFQESLDQIGQNRSKTFLIVNNYFYGRKVQ